MAGKPGILGNYAKYVVSVGTALMAAFPVGMATLFTVTAIPFSPEALVSRSDLIVAVLLATVAGSLWFGFCLGLGVAHGDRWLVLPSILMVVPLVVVGLWLGVVGLLVWVALFLFVMGLAGHFLCRLLGARKASVVTIVGVAIISAGALIAMGEMAAQSPSFQGDKAFGLWLLGMLTLGFLPFARMERAA